MPRPDSFAAQPIIDFRLRPPYGDLLDLRIWDAGLRDQFAGKLRVRQAPSAVERSLDLLLAEMDALGVVTGVLNARADGRAGVGSAGNGTAAELQQLHPGRFRGFGAVDLNAADWEGEAVRAVAELALAGISIDPGFSRPAIAADDACVHQLAGPLRAAPRAADDHAERDRGAARRGGLGRRRSTASPRPIPARRSSSRTPAGRTSPKRSRPPSGGRTSCSCRTCTWSASRRARAGDGRQRDRPRAGRLRQRLPVGADRECIDAGGSWAGGGRGAGALPRQRRAPHRGLRRLRSRRRPSAPSR